MEANICDINHLNSDAHLPPRKRLLAGLKKLNFDGNSHQPSSSNPLTEFDVRLNNLLGSHLHNPNLSPEEIVEASRSEAMAAVKAAEAARAMAEEKAAIAAKAVAAAKSALELVASVSEDTASNSKEKCSKKNKMKKHVPVQMLYNKRQRVANCKTDEEIARKLHQVINSSPRISKNSSPTDSKNQKHKRLKRSCTPEKSRVSNGFVGLERNPPSTSNGNSIVGEVDSKYSGRVDESTSKFNKGYGIKMGNSELETSNSKDKIPESSDDTCSISRRRGRIKQKKLPLSICTFRDRVGPKDEPTSKISPLTEENTGKPTSGNVPLFPVESSSHGVMPVETTSMWKCQAFKVPACVKQNKVMQS